MFIGADDDLALTSADLCDSNIPAPNTITHFRIFPKLSCIWIAIKTMIFMSKDKLQLLTYSCRLIRRQIEIN